MLAYPDILITQASENTGSGFMSMILMFGAMFAILYFVMIRPQQKQQKRQRKLIASLKKGDDVILNSGIIGKIYSVDEKLLTLEIGDKIRLKVLKHAVQTVGTPEQLTPQSMVSAKK